MSFLYCRRCDLAFCEDHEHLHPDLPGHELKADERASFCSVCVGIFKPLAVAGDEAP
jgi:hypothetical protein